MKAKHCPFTAQGCGHLAESEQDAREKQVPENDRVRPTFPVSPCSVCSVSGSSGARQRKTGTPGEPDSGVEESGPIMEAGVVHIPLTSTSGSRC